MSTIAPTGRDYDPVTLEVIRMRLDAIVDEMAIAMMRSSGSPVITEAGDFNTALFDAEGRIYAYSNYVQFHIGSASVALRGLLDVVPREEMEPGDAFISNDSHTAGSTHPPDVSVITPIFHDGEVIAFAQSQAHLLDIGGMNPGGFAPSAVDCFAEALRMPPGVKCYERGEPVESVRRMIVNNVRLPVIFWNDVRSLVASNNTGARRLRATIEEFGADTFTRYADQAIVAAHDVVAGRIADLPDGVYEAHEWQEGDGKTTDLLPVHCRMTIRGVRARVRLLGVQPADGRLHQLLLRRARRQRRHRDEPDAGVGPAVQPGRTRPGDDRRRRREHREPVDPRTGSATAT